MTERKSLERRNHALLKDLNAKVDYLIESRREYVFGRRFSGEYEPEGRVG